ncbi:unnamed protein product [Effrenium voratum]|uniref:DNA mismatch repair proteins mutS family domain-containing protein n=1 Tax=Effrenium voratum TaxID=2562239 RepID=A0AA36HM88_9DINO|nr:unnamed protein product [Effrenium voratum]CAJ1414632.1 unnamed protein product [Effrenium voratum]
MEVEDPQESVDVSVVFALCSGRGRCGLAYVDLDEPERVLRVSDFMDPNFCQLDRLKQQLLAPSGATRSGLCLVPSRSPAELLKAAARPLGEEAASEPFPTATVKAGDFEAEAGQVRLQQLFASLGEDAYRINPLVALERNEQLLRAAGGLLRFLEQNRILLGDLEGQWQGPMVQDVRIFSPEDTVFVDSQTMIALQIFQEQQKFLLRSSKPREGLSLYGLLEPLAASSAGRAMLRRWLNQPSRDRELLQRRFGAVEHLLSLLAGPNAELARQLHRELMQIQDLPRLLSRMHRCYNFDNMSDWRSLITTLHHMSTLLGLLQNPQLKGGLPDLAGQHVLSDVQAAERLLQRVVDWDASGAGEFDASLVRVQSGVDQSLDELRHQHANIDQHLTKIARLERRRLSHLGDRISLEGILFHYFPQLGFHCSIPDEQLEEQPAVAPDWRFQFEGYGRFFYKCDMARRLDCEVGDLVIQARKVELEILMQLLSRLRVLEPRLRAVFTRLAELDVLLAFAGAALQHRWRRPKLAENAAGRLHVVRGRHPLVEAVGGGKHGFVPNSTEIGVEDEGNDMHRVQVITGANLAGKSVYLKQVGLITFMAHVGCFVPADEAELGVCDFIFSRIQSCETASTQCSSFTMDLCQLSLALQHATEASLVLLDEFGKGTRAADGVALLGATVEYLCRLPRGPKARGQVLVLLTTHFTEIFRLNLVSETERYLQLSHLRVLPAKETEGDQDEEGPSIAYLYQLVEGCCEKSFGLDCARQAGLHPEVLSRAQQILSSIEAGRPIERVSVDEKDLARSWGVIRRLCALDTEDEIAAKAFLAHVAQEHLLGQLGG